MNIAIEHGISPGSPLYANKNRPSEKEHVLERPTNYMYIKLNVKVNSFTSHRLLLVVTMVTIIVFICGHM